jgi:hypothetical protein
MTRPPESQAPDAELAPRLMRADRIAANIIAANIAIR